MANIETEIDIPNGYTFLRIGFPSAGGYIRGSWKTKTHPTIYKMLLGVIVEKEVLHECVGRWCIVWDSNEDEDDDDYVLCELADSMCIRKITGFYPKTMEPFNCYDGVSFQHAKPLPEDFIKELGLGK